MASDDTASSDPTIRNNGLDLDTGGPTAAWSAAPRHSVEDDVSPLSREAKHVSLPVGTALNEYVVEAVLGSGGFGITYLARDTHLQCQVAIKEYLPTHLAVRQDGNSVCPRTESDTHGYRLGLDRFLAETRVLAGFRHPNIVRVTRFFEANNTAYMVMDYERGQPLKSWLAAQNGIDEARLLRMLLPLLEGLEVVHKSGVLHRDIKPANIYVREHDDSLVLLDFGAARQASGGTSRSLTSIVTPGYAPFEQYHTHGAQGPWSDIYAMGGVMYCIVTGQKPVEAPSRVKRDIMPKAAALAADRGFGPRFLAAIDWALATDEENRPRDIAEFVAVLTGAQPVPTTAASAAASMAPPPTAHANPQTPGRTARWPLAVAALAVVALGGYLATRTEKSAETHTAVAPVAAPSASAAPTQPAVATAEAKPVAAVAPTPPKPKAASAEKPKAAQTEAPKPAPAPVKEATATKETKPAPPVVAQATLIFEIAPDDEAAEVVVDGVKRGAAPPMRELKLAAGKHKVELHRIKWPGIHYFSVDLQQDEKKKLSVVFGNPL